MFRIERLRLTRQSPLDRVPEHRLVSRDTGTGREDLHRELNRHFHAIGHRGLAGNAIPIDGYRLKAEKQRHSDSPSSHPRGTCSDPVVAARIGRGRLGRRRPSPSRNMWPHSVGNAVRYGIFVGHDDMDKIEKIY